MISDRVKNLEDNYEKMKFLLGYLLVTLELNQEKGHLSFSSEEAKNSWEACFSDVKSRYLKLGGEETWSL